MSYLIDDPTDAVILGPGFEVVAGEEFYAGPDPAALPPLAQAAPAPADATHVRLMGRKQYELKDHLGNVRVVVTDRKSADLNAGVLSNYRADVVHSAQYYAFGMEMPGLNYNSNNYRYGFNGKERDKSFGASSVVYDYGFRIYNPSLGKFLSVDPLTKSYSMLTPYQFAGNSPIANIDLDGMEPDYYLNQKSAELLGDGTITTASDATGIITAVQMNAELSLMHGARIDQDKLTQYLRASQGAIRNNDLTSTAQYQFQKEMIDIYGDYVLPVEITGKLIRGEEVTTAELGIEALGLIPAGKILGKGTKLLKGVGGDILEAFVKKVDNQASHLTDLDLQGAVKDIFGNPVIINGKTYNHLKEVKDALRGLGRELSNLNKAIDNGQLSGEVLGQAKRLRSDLQKQKDVIQNILEKASKQAEDIR